MGTDYAAVAKLLAVPARSTMVDVLLEGRALTAGELATCAGIGRPAASEHLRTLVDGGLLSVEVSGRHRYYAVADERTAAALEALSLICPSTPVRSLRTSTDAQRLAGARLCYDHIAGRLGVDLADAVFDRGWLRRSEAGIDLTDRTDELSVLGVDLDTVRTSRRTVVLRCLDWTERRHHLAGAIGAAIADHALREGWLRRIEGGRGLRLTEEGRTAFGRHLGLSFD